MDSPLMTRCYCEAPCSAARHSSPRAYLDAAAQRRADLATAQGDVDRYLAVFPWCQRVAAYWEIVSQLRVPDRVRCLRDLWDVDARPSSRLRAWRRELSLCSQNPATFMSASEHKLRLELTKPLTIFRGVASSEQTPTGFAWSLDRDFADFVAYSACRGRDTSGHVFAAVCNPDDAIAYLIDAEGRDDVAIFPECLVSWGQIPTRQIVETVEPSGAVWWTVAK